MSPNWVTKLSSILVITKFVIKYGDKFVTKFFTKQHHNPSSMKRAKRNGTHLPPPLPPPPLPPPPLLLYRHNACNIIQCIGELKIKTMQCRVRRAKGQVLKRKWARLARHACQNRPYGILLQNGSISDIGN